MKDEAELLAQTNPLEISQESKFLLEIDISRSVNGTYSELNYRIGVVKTTKETGKKVTKLGAFRKKNS